MLPDNFDRVVFFAIQKHISHLRFADPQSQANSKPQHQKLNKRTRNKCGRLQSFAFEQYFEWIAVAIGAISTGYRSGNRE
jgi:hypothetical protein